MHVPSVFFEKSFESTLLQNCSFSYHTLHKPNINSTNILQLQRTTPLSYLEGELFKADVTCDNEGGNAKLFFKHNGTRNLLEKGSQLRTMYIAKLYKWLNTNYNYCMISTIENTSLNYQQSYFSEFFVRPSTIVRTITCKVL